LDTFNIIPYKPVTLFKDFVKEYDYKYASPRCEEKIGIDECAYNAGKQGQLYWIYYYLEKEPANADKAFLGALEGGHINIARYLFEVCSDNIGNIDNSNYDYFEAAINSNNPEVIGFLQNITQSDEKLLAELSRI
jgi:hypothetical protein